MRYRPWAKYVVLRWGGDRQPAGRGDPGGGGRQGTSSHLFCAARLEQQRPRPQLRTPIGRQGTERASEMPSTRCKGGCLAPGMGQGPAASNAARKALSGRNQRERNNLPTTGFPNLEILGLRRPVRYSWPRRAI